MLVKCALMFLKKRLTAIVFCMMASFMAVGAVPEETEDFLVVIDPGHGGKDFGCHGSKIHEKHINLAVAKRLTEKINANMPGVRAVMTRDTDCFLSLNDRARYANNVGGDLFISIHVNSLPEGNPYRKSTQGFQIFTLGPDKTESNLRIAMRENSVIELEDDYTEVYKGFDPSSTESYIIFELNQNAHMRRSVEFAEMLQAQMVQTAGRRDKGVHQGSFWVLAASAMPSVLVELDFICNPDSEKFLGSAEGHDRCSEAIFRAINDFVNKKK